MGQYQQWLHYQEIDRHLRTQLEALEADLYKKHWFIFEAWRINLVCAS